MNSAMKTADIASSHTNARAPRRRRRPARYYLEAYSFLGLLVAAFAFFSMWPKTADTFLSAANMQVLIGGNTVIAMVALGSLVPLVCNEWDLSIGANAGLASVSVAIALAHGSSLIYAILIGLAVGLAVGAVNALLVTRLGVNAVISTLGISIILGGVISVRTHGQGVSGDFPTASSASERSTGSAFPGPPLRLSPSRLPSTTCSTTRRSGATCTRSARIGQLQRSWESGRSGSWPGALWSAERCADSPASCSWLVRAARPTRRRFTHAAGSGCGVPQRRHDQAGSVQRVRNARRRVLPSSSQQRTEPGRRAGLCRQLRQWRRPDRRRCLAVRLGSRRQAV